MLGEATHLHIQTNYSRLLIRELVKDIFTLFILPFDPFLLLSCSVFVETNEQPVSTSLEQSHIG